MLKINFTPRLVALISALALLLALLVACEGGASTEQSPRERRERPPTAAAETDQPESVRQGIPGLITGNRSPTDPDTETVDSPLASDTEGKFTSVSAGGYHTCGLKVDNSVVCWGGNDYGQATPPAGEFLSVSAGFYHACGLKGDGTVQCWGQNPNWHGDATPPAGEFASVNAGWSHTCGMKVDGSVQCWGSDNYSQATPPAEQFATVSAGGLHTCGLKADGSIECWGDDTGGKATPPAGQFATVSAGWSHTCGMKVDGSVECWGSDHHPERTDGIYWTGHRVGEFASVGAGSHHNCGVKRDGSVECWGWNNYSQATPPAGQFTSVSAGEYHTCGLKVDDSVECWGSNEQGQATPPSEVFAIAHPPDTPAPAPEPPVETGSPETDRAALVELYDLAGGSNWEWGSGCSRWEVGNDSSNVGEWCGVTVDSNGRVTRLELSGVNLNNGYKTLLSPRTTWRKLPILGELTALTHLDLSGNHLGGALPPELDQLTRLTHLNLSGNAFRGYISERNEDYSRGIEWQNLQNLVVLNLSDNRRRGEHGLGGRIPPELGFLANLQALELSNNNLSGAVPPTLVELKELNLSESSLLKNPGLTCRPDGLRLGSYLPTCTDRDWLVEFFEVTTTEDEKWARSDNWGSDKPISQWPGVIVDPVEPNKVIGLFLPDNNLAGDVDIVLGVLSGFESMQYTDISKNPLMSDDPLGFQAKILSSKWGKRFSAGKTTYLHISGEPTVEGVVKLTKILADLALEIPEITDKRLLRGMLSSLSQGISNAGQWLGFAVEVAQYAQLFSVLHSLDLKDLTGTYDAVYEFLNIPTGARYYPLKEALFLSCVADYPGLTRTEVEKVCWEDEKQR